MFGFKVFTFVDVSSEVQEAKLRNVGAITFVEDAVCTVHCCLLVVKVEFLAIDVVVAVGSKDVGSFEVHGALAVVPRGILTWSVAYLKWGFDSIVLGFIDLLVPSCDLFNEIIH